MHTGRQFLVSDIHGHFDTFLAALEAASFSFKNGDRLRIIGDIVDRGPKSREMYLWIREHQEKYPDQVAYHMGNHEWMFLLWLSGQDKTGIFFYNGGWATVASFLAHLDGAEDLHRETPLVEQGKWLVAMKEEYPDLHDYLARLPLIHETEDAIFVHAGIDVTKPLSEQTEDDVLWIREEWINVENYLGKMVVFGHTPVANMQGHNLNPFGQKWFQPHPTLKGKLGIDGGAPFEDGAVFLVEWPSLNFYRIPVEPEQEKLVFAADDGRRQM